MLLDNKYNIIDEPLYQDQNLIDDINFGFAKTINVSDNESYTIIVMNKEIYTGRKYTKILQFIQRFQ